MREVRLPKEGEWGCHSEWDTATIRTWVNGTCTNWEEVNMTRINAPFVPCPRKTAVGYLIRLGRSLFLFSHHLSAGTFSPSWVSHKEGQFFWQRIHFHFYSQPSHKQFISQDVKTFS